MEAATVLWNGNEKKFESVENAVIFAMESLSAADQATVMVQTDTRALGLTEIESVYDSTKGKKP